VFSEINGGRAQVPWDFLLAAYFVSGYDDSALQQDLGG